MSFLEDNCTFSILTQEILDSCNSFDCGDDDLNDFFANDSVNYSRQLIGKSYCFRLNENPSEIVCAFTISNDSIRAHLLPGSRRRKFTNNIPSTKRLRRYPAVLIGRLGVSNDYRGQGIGTEVMNLIKYWFIEPKNKTGCRFIVVDAYNTPNTRDYYFNNGFNDLFSTEDQEKEYTRSAGSPLKTRLMYFELIDLFFRENAL